MHLIAVTSGERIRGLWERWQKEGQQLVAPVLLRYEVTNALYRYQKAGMISGDATMEALNAAFALPIQFYNDLELHKSALAMAGHFGLPAAYDAHYLALAERLGAIFITTDRRLVNAVQSALPWVQLAET